MQALDRYRIDATESDEGRWFAHPDGGEWRIARLGTAKMLDLRLEWIRSAGLQPDDHLSQAQSEACSAHLFAHGVVRGYRDQADPEATYLPAMGVAIYQEQELRELKAWILGQANTSFQKRAKIKATIMGN